MKILANDGIAASGKEMLEAAGFTVVTEKVAQENLIDAINNESYVAVLVRSATKVRKDIIDACPGLKLIGRGGVGMDNIDVAYAREKGLHVINTPAASSHSVAELVFAHLMGMVRFLHDANRNMPLEGESNFGALKKSYGAGQELKGKKIGIIGFGRIGQATAKIALGLGMEVIAHNRTPKELDITLDFYNGQQMSFPIKTVGMDELLSESDFISLHMPAADKPVLAAAEFAKMKDGVAVINAARGGIVDEVALVEALDKGKVRYAGLDVFENEPKPAVKLLMHPQVSLTPHIGGATAEAQSRIGTELATQMITLLK